MIVLDTHIWVWWVHRDSQLPAAQQAYVQAHVAQGLGVSVFSCWEVAKLDLLGRLPLPLPVKDWLNFALAEPGIRLLELTPEIAVESNHLPGNFSSRPSGSTDYRYGQSLWLPAGHTGWKNSALPARPNRALKIPHEPKELNLCHSRKPSRVC